MSTFFGWAIAIIVIGGILGFIFGKSGEKEDSAKMGAAFGFSVILQLLPFIVLIAIIVAVVKAMK